MYVIETCHIYTLIAQPYIEYVTITFVLKNGIWLAHEICTDI